PPALLVHWVTAGRLLPLDEPGHALHVADHEHLHPATTSPTSSPRLFSTGTLANFSRPGRKEASAGESARWAPSSTLSANPAPSGVIPQSRPSAPPFASQPGAARIRFVSSEPSPPISSGCARIVAAIRSPPSSSTRRENADAIRSSERPKVTTPQPSVAVASVA